VDGCSLIIVTVAQEMLTFAKGMRCDMLEITVRMIVVDWKDLGLDLR
jgi:hypothetical protein